MSKDQRAFKRETKAFQCHSKSFMVSKLANATDTLFSYKIETYSIIDNVDESILLLNDFLIKYGYRFVSFDLSELEEKFSDLFLLPKEFTSNTKLQLKDGHEISKEFYNAIQHNPLFGIDLITKGKLFFLKKIEDIEVNESNNANAFQDSFHFFAEINKFTSNLIQQLRLLKHGPIGNTIQFQVSVPFKNVTTRFSSRFAKSSSLKVFQINEEDVELFQKSFKNEFVINSLSELAIQNLNLSYEARDIKSKYLLLMMCLESMFNRGSAPISHTVSRHLAIVLSKSLAEFQEHYKSIRELYQVRNDIAHGGHLKKDLSELTIAAENYVRKSISYCLQTNLNKESLFEHLNASGFSSP